MFEKPLTTEQRLKITGMDMLMRRFKKMPDSTTITVEELIAASNDIYNQIVSDSGNDDEDGHVNLFKKPMTEQEQLELSDLLDDFHQMYENGFADQVTGDEEADADNLKYEFGGLYEMVEKLTNRALN